MSETIRRSVPRPRVLAAGALFAFAAGAGLRTPEARAAPSPATVSFASFDPGSRSWTVGNALIAASFRLGPSGRLFTTALRDRTRNVLLVPADLRAPEFRLVVRLPKSGGNAWGDAVELTGAAGWDLEEHEETVDGDGVARVDVVLVSRDGRLAVALHRVCTPESPVVRSFIDVENRSGGPLLLEAADSLVLGFRSGGDVPALFSVNNFTWAAEASSFATRETPLAADASVRLTTGPYGGQAAWFALRSGALGGGLFGGWEWSGTGEMAFAADGTGGVRFRVGLASGVFSHRLEAGETFSSPRAFVGVFSGGWDAAGAATRDFVEARIAPKLPAPDFPWTGFDTWGYGPELDERLVHALVDRAADLGAEFFTLDYGWMEREGDWTPKAGAFDGGLEEISAHAHSRGMRFGLWMALGSADPASTVLEEHPDWGASVDGVPVLTDYGGRAICLANPDARAWVVSEVTRVVETYGVDWLLHDFTVITRCNDTRHGHGPGDGEWASTAGYYAVLDAVRSALPGLVIENCWDGGGMVDFGMAARHDTSATNDRNDATGNRRAVYGATYLLPPRFVDKYVGDDGTGDAYRFLSGVPGGPLILMGRPTSWEETTVEAVRSAVRFFKRARGVLRDGEVFHLTAGPGEARVDALQSWDAVRGTGYIFAFQGGIATDPGGVNPAGLDPAASYDVTVWNGTTRARTGEARSVPGDQLMRDGVGLGLFDDQGAAIVTIQRR